MVVTAVRKAGTQGDRLGITLDRKPAGQIDALAADRLGLVRGVTLTDEQAHHLALALDHCAAQKLARRLIQTRDRSSGELRDRLRRAGHRSGAIEQVVERMLEIGAIDDARLAERLAGSLADRGNSGRRLIELKLAQKGVSRTLATTAAAEATAPRDALADATALARKRVRQASPRLDRQALSRRVYAFLARRGFEAQVCQQACRAALGELSHADEVVDEHDPS